MDKKTNVRQNILDSALILFSEKGYEGVSVSEMTEVSGITKPTLYYYFGNKEGLFDAVCCENYGRLNSIVTKSAEYIPHPENYYSDIYKALHNIVSAYFPFAVENEAFYRLVMANMHVPRSSVAFDVVQKYHYVQYEIVGKMFQDMAVSHGNLMDKDKRLSWSFIGTINAYIGIAFSGLMEESLSKNTAKELVHQFMHGIYA